MEYPTIPADMTDGSSLWLTKALESAGYFDAQLFGEKLSHPNYSQHTSEVGTIL